ncbi:MAG TPA: argininosuccinate lyase [Elusimicrobiota bacterium]|nr:argininosuccinate lyase [Elusimicrobiota bacterium]
MNPQSFIASLSFDVRLAPYDIQGSLAHVRMLAKCRIISSRDAQRIQRGLESIAKDLDRGKRLPPEEDIHYAIERELIRRIGAVGGKLHTARSRNDQVALDLRLYLRDQVRMIVREVARLQGAFVTVAEQNFDVIMPGFTHLQHAQPILFAHHMLAYAWMLERDKGRLRDAWKRADEMPLGSAALAGTSFPIDRRFVARQLGFSRVSANSIDTVSDRDFVAEFCAAASLVMMHLSRLAEELILWSSSEFNIIRLQTEFTSGSSIMPQKRNPDVAEIIRGETGRIYGNLMAILTVLKGLPLSYNRDLQEDKPPFFDTVDTLQGCLAVASPMIATMVIRADRMRALCDRGFLAATELADYLTSKNRPFRQAHGIVKRIVAYCEAQRIRLDELTIHELRRFDDAFDGGALKVLSVDQVVHVKNSEGGTSPRRVRQQIAQLRRLLR